MDFNHFSSCSDGTHGPSLPPNLLPGHADEDTDVVGPLPEGMIGESSTQRALEMRALLLKHEMNNKVRIVDIYLLLAQREKILMLYIFTI